MITVIRLTLSTILLFAEIFFPNINMIVIMATVFIIGALLIDRQHAKIEDTLVCQLLSGMKRGIISAVSKPRER